MGRLVSSSRSHRSRIALLLAWALVVAPNLHGGWPAAAAAQQPVWSPIKDVDLKYAVNTNWDVFEDAAKTLYLRHEARGSRRRT